MNEITDQRVHGDASYEQAPDRFIVYVSKVTRAAAHPIWAEVAAGQIRTTEPWQDSQYQWMVCDERTEWYFLFNETSSLHI